MKPRAIIVSYKALVDNRGFLRHFISLITDCIELSDYADLVIVGENREEMAQFCYQNCIKAKTFIESTEPYDAIISSLVPKYKTLGIIVGRNEDYKKVNRRLVTVLAIS